MGFHRVNGVLDQQSGHVAGTRRSTADTMGSRLLCGHCATLEGGRLHQLHGSERPGARHSITAPPCERPIDIKKKHDAGNLFRVNQNIRVPDVRDDVLVQRKYDS